LLPIEVDQFLNGFKIKVNNDINVTPTPFSSLSGEFFSGVEPSQFQDEYVRGRDITYDLSH
jgi:hypothetical protein